MAAIHQAVLAALDATDFDHLLHVVVQEWPLILGLDAVALGLVVGTALFGAALVIVANLVVDIVHGLIDPRIRRA